MITDMFSFRICSPSISSIQAKKEKHQAGYPEDLFTPRGKLGAAKFWSAWRHIATSNSKPRVYLGGICLCPFTLKVEVEELKRMVDRRSPIRPCESTPWLFMFFNRLRTGESSSSIHRQIMAFMTYKWALASTAGFNNQRVVEEVAADVC